MNSFELEYDQVIWYHVIWYELKKVFLENINGINSNVIKFRLI